MKGSKTKLTRKDWELFIKLLRSNKEPNSSLKKAVKRYKEFKNG